jgi:hypothetical protein
VTADQSARIAEVRAFLAAAEEHLRDSGGSAMPQAVQVFLLRLRGAASLTDEELERIINESAGVTRSQLEGAMTSFAEMFSSPMIRALTGLPPAAEAAARAALAAEQAACRHVLARAAAGSKVPCSTCIAHPGEVRCVNCNDQHVTETHSPEHELTCDWCGAVCLHQIFPMPLALGSLTVVRNLSARRSWHVGPAFLGGLGACYGCHRRLEKESRSFGDLLASLDAEPPRSAR